MPVADLFYHVKEKSAMEMEESNGLLFEATDGDGHRYEIFLDGRVEGFSSDTKMVKWFIPVLNMLRAQANQKSKSACRPAST